MKLVFKPLQPFFAYDTQIRVSLGKLYFVKKYNGKNAIIGSTNYFNDNSIVEVEDKKEHVNYRTFTNYLGEVCFSPLIKTKEIYKTKKKYHYNGVPVDAYIMPNEDWQRMDVKSSITGEEIEKKSEDYDVQTANIQHFVVCSAVGLLGGFLISKIFKINPAKSMIAGTIIGFSVGGLTKNS